MEYSSKSEIRLILLGKTGSGKSRTGNSILGRRAFQFQSTSGSCTPSCEIESSRRFETKLVVIDTPGLFDSCIDNAKVQEQVWKSILFSLPGPHFFLLCIEMGRLTKQEDDVIQHYINHFGEGIIKHMIFVFTKSDMWIQGMIDSGVKNPDALQYLKQLPPNAKHILRKCEDRYVVFNNRHVGELDDKQVHNLVRIAKTNITNKRDSEYFTNDKFKKADQIFRELVTKNSIDMEEEKTTHGEEKNRKGEKKDDTFTKEKVKKALFRSFMQVLGGALVEGVKFGIEQLLK